MGKSSGQEFTFSGFLIKMTSCILLLASTEKTRDADEAMSVYCYCCGMSFINKVKITLIVKSLWHKQNNTFQTKGIITKKCMGDIIPV